MGLLRQMKTRLEVSAHRIRNRKKYLRSAIDRVHMESSGRFTKYTLEDTEELTGAGNTKAAFAFLTELRERKQSQDEGFGHKKAPVGPSAGKLQFVSRRQAGLCKANSKGVPMATPAVMLSHLEDEADSTSAPPGTRTKGIHTLGSKVSQTDDQDEAGKLSQSVQFKKKIKRKQKRRHKVYRQQSTETPGT